MSMKTVWLTSLAVAALLVALPTGANSQELEVGPGDIGGVVTGPAGPEAGVWVIAESTGLGVRRFAKIVVTDDAGRYLLPDLPANANFNVWVRGYGLVDSNPVNAEPGQELDLVAVPAADPAEAAQYYPGGYWWAMLDVPDASLFPGTGPQGNGMPDNFQSQVQWLNSLKANGCGNCHQIGGPIMRTIAPVFNGFGDSQTAWLNRLNAGQGGPAMTNQVGNMMTNDGGLLARLAAWTDRIAEGEIPREAPQRPQGLERNLVVTIWDWHRPTAYLHDLIATDKRDPTVNAWGKLYGAMELSTDWTPILDPIANVSSDMLMPMMVPSPRSSTVNPVNGPSQFWGMRQLWDTQVNAHTNMMDQDGRVWWTASIRPQWEQPAFCQEGSDHPSARVFPLVRASGNANNTTNFVQNARGVTMYDPATQQWAHVDTCFGTHHLNFAYDDDNTLFLANNGGPQLGWVNTRVFLETGDSALAQGWTPFILDTNGNGVRDAWVEPNDPVDPTKDKRVVVGYYGISVNPVDGTVWGSNSGGPGRFVRVDLGSDPSETALTEVYEVPAPGYGIRGMDLDSKGIAWAAGQSGHLISFDRSKCAVLNGPTATGQHCPEGFTMYPLPGPKFEGVANPEWATVSTPYYVWVDMHDTLGLGADTVIVLDNTSDGLQAFVQESESWVRLAVPYPMAFFTKGLDGRIDDPDGGWAARGLWATWGGRAPWHSEGGRGSTPYVAHIQLRPDPLAGADL
jgi:hypothetical protein